MFCYCNCCKRIFSSDISHTKYEIPRHCPLCHKMVCITPEGQKIPAVRPATEEEVQQYNDEIRDAVDLLYMLYFDPHADEDEEDIEDDEE